MYEAFFNFEMKPFELVPNPHFLYMSNMHQRAMNYLHYGFAERAGFILLTGEIGSGKTTLVRALINQLDERAVIARIFHTQINAAQLVGLVNMDFGLDITTLDKTILLADLNDFLIDCYARGEKPLLIIDEAQNLSPDVLEEIRLLSNLETENEKLLQIIMVGQPELNALLERRSLKQLRQRLSVSCHLGALNEKETQAYFYHRLQCAGNRKAIQVPEASFEPIHAVCRGIPRLINIFGDYLLLAAFNEQKRRISNEMVLEVLEELRHTVAFSQPEAAEAAPGDRRQNDWRDDPELLDTLRLVRENEPDQEATLKNIIRRQIVQIDRLQDQLDAIGASLHAIETRLKKMSGPKSADGKSERNSLKEVLAKVQRDLH